MTEDTPFRLVLIDSAETGSGRGYGAIRDNDNTLDELNLEVQGSEHLTATATTRPGEKIITLTPAANWFGGPETILLTVFDPREKVGQGQFSVRVSPVNDAPTLASIPEHTVAEDTDLRIDLSPFVGDIDNPVESMTWSARYNRNRVRIRISRGVAIVRGAPNYFGGPVPVQFTARDPSGQSAATVANIRITPVNDPPEVTQIPPISFEEDGNATVNLDLYAEDPDNNDRQLIWTAEPDEPLRVRIDERTRRAEISAPENWGGGERRVTFSVRDPAGLTNRVVAAVSVASVNDAPVISSIPPQQFREDETLELDMDPFVADVDNAKRDIRWTVANGPHIRATVDRATRRATFSAPRNWYGGPETLTFTATDPGGLSASREVAVRVTTVPEPPALSQIPQVTVNEDETYVVTLDRFLSDPDHENSQLTLNVRPPRNVRAELDRANRRITISAPQNWNGGPETVTVEAVDPDNERASTTFQVTFTAVNDPPELTEIPAVSVDEDQSTSLSLGNFVTDPDNQKSELVWEVTGQQNIQVNVANGVASFRPSENWNGSERVTITVRDPGGLTARQRVNVTANAVNDPPRLIAIPEVAFPEDESETVRLYPFVTDVDNSNGQLQWRTSGHQHVRVAISEGGRAVFSAEQDWFGGEVVNLTVTDPGGLSDTKTIMVTVGPVNDLPQIADIPDQTIEEDGSTTLELAPFVTDPDNDPATMRWAPTGGEHVRVTVNRGIASISAEPNWHGTERITMTTTDPGGLSNRKIMRVTVRPVNDGPVLQALTPVAVNEDETTTLDLNSFVSDADNTNAQLAWTVTGSDKVNVRVVNGVANISAEQNWFGEENLTVTVTDPGRLSATRPLNVRFRAVNDPPQLANIPLVVFSEDGNTNVALLPLVTDPDNGPQQMTFAFGQSQNITTVLGPDNTATFSSAPNYTGETSIPLTVTDPGGLSSTRNVAIRVQAVNDPPVLRGLPPVQFAEDGTTRLDLKEYASDVDDAVAQLTWTSSGATNVRVSIARGVATFSAAENWNGRELITVNASDPGGLTAESTTWVTVTAVNDPPVLRSIPAQRTSEDQAIEVALNDYVTDPDNELGQLSWRFTGGQNVRVTEAGGTASIEPTENWSGSERINVVVRDPAGLEATASFPVTVDAVNDPPVLAAFASVTFPEDGSTVIDLAENVTDPDNTVAQLRWSFSEAVNVHATVTGTRARLTADANWNGQESIVLTVTDPSGATASTGVSVIVSPVNDPPVVSALPAARFEEDGRTQVDLSSFATDVDGDHIAWSVASQNPNIRASMAGAMLSISAAPNWSGGPATLTLTATDGAGGTDSKPLSVTVTPVNDPPSVGTISPVTFAEDGSTTLNLSGSISDPDDALSALRISVAGGTQVRASVSGTSLQLSAAANWSGVEQLTVTVRDAAGLEATGTVNVTVSAVNDAPTVRSIPAVTIERDQSRSVDLSAYATDIEGDAIAWNTTGSPRGLAVSISGSRLEIVALRTAEAGTQTVNLVARDAGGAQTRATVSVTVHVPPPPPPPQVEQTPAPQRGTSP